LKITHVRSVVKVGMPRLLAPGTAIVFDLADNAGEGTHQAIGNMQAMRWHGAGKPLSLEELPAPRPQENQVLLRVRACGVCRTDLHLLDGELPSARCPVTPGHEVVGEVVDAGRGATRFRLGERIGVPWLARTCGTCRYCRAERENLCEQATFTGHTVDGGYAEYAVADERYCHAIPARYSDAEAAPLLCAGLIGYRAYRAAREGVNLGLYGFGAAAHLLAQLARAEERRVFAFTRPGDVAAQDFARSLGVVWAGDSDRAPPEPLDAAILFAPVGALIPTALAATRKGGCVVCAGIHMSDIPAFPYRLLWGERTVSSVANLTRADGAQFMALAASVALHPAVESLPLTAANEALARLRSGKVNGAAVLVP
jgi:propanol-preferring alcohol dehydrogenase